MAPNIDHAALAQQLLDAARKAKELVANHPPVPAAEQPGPHTPRRAAPAAPPPGAY